jgi:outer membrane protein assembly factor BamB
MKQTIAFILTSAAVLAADANWPQFRGPAASGAGTGAPPSQWNVESHKNVLWSAEIPGLAHSSPIVWGDRIFVTSAVPASGDSELKVGLYGAIQPVKDEGSHKFMLYCLDRKTGRILWEREAVSEVPKILRHPKSTHANPTPVTDGKHVVAFFGSEGLFAFDMNGKQLWRKDLGTLDSGYYVVVSAQWGFASSPIIHKDKVIIEADVQKDSFLAAFDVNTGKELWRTARKDVPTFGTPAIAPYTAGGANREQVVLNGWKEIAGYDVADGKQLWTMKGGGDIPVPTPLVKDGLIVITNAHGPGRPIYAIRTDAAGDLNEKKDAIAWQQEKAGNYMQTPLIDGGLAYFCYDNGVFTVFELKNGERIYQQRLGGGTSGFTSSPVAAGGKLYVTNEEGHTYVIGLGREFKILAENDLGEVVMATPAVSDGVLYIRGRKHLYAIASK